MLPECRIAPRGFPGGSPRPAPDGATAGPWALPRALAGRRPASCGLRAVPSGDAASGLTTCLTRLGAVMYTSILACVLVCTTLARTKNCPSQRAHTRGTRWSVETAQLPTTAFSARARHMRSMAGTSGLSSFLEAGNTQPGGFCRGLMDSMKRPDTPHGSSTSPPPRFGMATQLSNEQRRGDVVIRTGERHVGFSSIVAPWQISDSMMHVPWGTVLRSLDPGSTNVPERRAPTPYVGSMGSARANPYSSAKNGHHMPGTHMRYSALSARHGALPEASVVM